MSNVVEVKSRGASVLALTTEDRREETGQIADGVFTIPGTLRAAPPLPERGPPAAVRLLRGPHAGL